MGRPREFVEADVIASATEAFWRGGIAATSITDLSEATGLSTGSLYKAFGSKGGLQTRTMEVYLDQGYGLVDELLDATDDPILAVRRWFALLAEQAARTDGLAGCYAVACATERAADDDDVAARLRAHDSRLRARLADALRIPHAEGKLRVPPEVAARVLTTVANGVSVEGRKGISREDAETTLATTLEGLLS